MPKEKLKFNSYDELNLFRQWFNAVQDLNPNYLEAKDYRLSKKIHEELGFRWSNHSEHELKRLTKLEKS